MMTQPAAATGATPNASAGAGADSTGTSTSGAKGGDVFSQTLQSLFAGAGNAGTPVPAADASTAEPGANPATADLTAGEGALIDGVMLPNARLQPSTSPLTSADGSNSPSARLRTDSARQAPTTAGAVPAMAKDLLRLLFAKHPALLTTDGAAPRAVAETGAEHDPGSDDEADVSASVSTAVADPSAAVTALLVQVPAQVPMTVALQWQQPSAAKSMRDSAVSPLSTTMSDAATSSADPLDLHPAIGTALTGSEGAPAAAFLTSPQGTLADAPRAPRLVPDVDATIDTSGMAAAMRATNAANAAPVEHTVAVPVHDRHWPTAMAAQVLILSGDKVRAATLRLTPEHLGPLEVRIDMQDSSVNVSFTAAHAETRSALEQAMPQLRSVLAGAGLTLGQATVQQQARQGSQNPNTTLRDGAGVDEASEAPVAVWRALGLIDEYA